MPDLLHDPELARALAALTGPELAWVNGSVLKVLYAILHAAVPLDGSQAACATFDDLVRREVLRPQDRGRRLCYIRHVELAHRAGLSKNTVSRCTRLLVRLGLIEKRFAQGGGGLPSNLFLLPDGRTAATTKGEIAMEFVVALYEKTIGPASEMIREELAPLVEQYTAEEWAAAFRQAAWSNVLRLTYVVKVLEGRAARRASQPCSPSSLRKEGNWHSPAVPHSSGHRAGGVLLCASNRSLARRWLPGYDEGAQREPTKQAEIPQGGRCDGRA